MERLKLTYEKEIVYKLMSKLSLKNKHEVPKINKIYPIKQSRNEFDYLKCLLVIRETGRPQSTASEYY